MAIVIDSRNYNKATKSADNRRKFLNRIRSSIKNALPSILAEGKFESLGGNDQKVKVPRNKLHEPAFVFDRNQVEELIIPGNEVYKRGDKIPKQKAGGKGKGGPGSPIDDGSSDDFIVQISAEEFINYFFHDLELPDLVKKQLATVEEFARVNNGYQTEGPPGRLSIKRSMQHAYLRRMALQGPYKTQLKEEEEKDEPDQEVVDNLKRKIKRVPFLDTFDLRYRYFSKTPLPITTATMFCIQDISGSMGEDEKTIARKFFYLMYLFLTKKYKKVDLVWIVHTAEAKEVGEEEFFSTSDSGGTVISTALELTKKLIKDKYNPQLSNLYVLQISDGDNATDDNSNVSRMLDELLPVLQFFAYIQIELNSGFEYPKVMNVYNEKKSPKLKSNIVRGPKDIWPMFQDLFSKG